MSPLKRENYTKLARKSGLNSTNSWLSCYAVPKIQILNRFLFGLLSHMDNKGLYFKK